MKTSRADSSYRNSKQPFLTHRLETFLRFLKPITGFTSCAPSTVVARYSLLVTF